MWQIFLPFSKILGPIMPRLLPFFLSFSIFINITSIMAAVDKLNNKPVFRVLLKGQNIFRVFLDELLFDVSYELKFGLKVEM
jgi:hypothetical protein